MSVANFLIKSLSKRTTTSSFSNLKSFSSHAPAKKDTHGKDAAHGHGHDEKHVIPKPPAKQYPNDHLFKFEEGDYVPPTETHAVGDEKDEIDYGPFEESGLKGPFGTAEQPVEVFSRFGSRIVGCSGSADEEHELLWHNLKLGKDLICMDCGQFFRLKTIPGFEHMAHGDGHGHGHHEEHDFHGHVDGDGFRYMYPPKTQAQLEKEKSERDEELKKDPKAPLKATKSEGVDYHHVEEHTDEGRISSKSPVFHDRRSQIYKDRK